MEYTYGFRIYLNDDQKVQLAKTFGWCRFIYNYFLDSFNIILFILREPKEAFWKFRKK